MFIIDRMQNFAIFYKDFSVFYYIRKYPYLKQSKYSTIFKVLGTSINIVSLTNSTKCHYS